MPVYRSHLLEYEQIALGRRLRRTRQRLGLTLSALSERAHLSTASLSQIENEQRVPSVRQLLVLARALGVPAESILPREIELSYQLTREADLRARKPPPLRLGNDAATAEYPHRFWPLADRFVGRHLEPLVGQLFPASDDLRYYCHHEDEFLFVSKGSVELEIRTAEGLHREVLQRGDCAYFRSELPHRLRSLGEHPAESIHVMSATSNPLSVSWSSMSGAWLVDPQADPTQRLVQKLGFLRRARGWSLREAARMAELKARQLEEIERGNRTIPLNVLVRLARIYGQPLERLIQCTVDGGPYVFVRRARDVERIEPRPRQNPVNAAHSQVFYPLAEGVPDRRMFPYLVKLLNVDVNSLTPHEHQGEEFFFVLGGELELVTHAGGKKVIEKLHAGDFCYLDSSVPHLLRSETRNPYSTTSAEVVVVFWCPLGEEYLFGAGRSTFSTKR